jgi:hypothetical protein
MIALPYGLPQISDDVFGCATGRCNALEWVCMLGSTRQNLHTRRDTIALADALFARCTGCASTVACRVPLLSDEVELRGKSGGQDQKLGTRCVPSLGLHMVYCGTQDQSAANRRNADGALHADFRRAVYVVVG